jgi:broad specificity phosphatase PhoE
MATAAPSLLIFVRHGHTAGNESGPEVPLEVPPEVPISGQVDLPLSPLGRRQVAALARRLAAGPPAAAVYASPLLRARDTARLLAGPHLGPLRLVEGLQEIDCGDADGMSIAEVQRRYPVLWRENQSQLHEEFRWPGGETYSLFRRRCLDAVRSLAADHPGERVVVVAHAGVIGQVLGDIHGLSAARWDAYRPGNASLTEVEWLGGTGRLVRFDDREHLADLNAAAELAAEPGEVSGRL